MLSAQEIQTYVLDLLKRVGVIERQTTITGEWVPTFTGFSADPAGGIYQYRVIGDWVELNIRQPNAGTSSSGAFTISLPFPAKDITNIAWHAAGPVVDSGALQAAPGMVGIAAGATTLAVYKDWSTAGFTGSGDKRLASVQIQYRKA